LLVNEDIHYCLLSIWNGVLIPKGLAPDLEKILIEDFFLNSIWKLCELILKYCLLQTIDNHYNASKNKQTKIVSATGFHLTLIMIYVY